MQQYLSHHFKYAKTCVRASGDNEDHGKPAHPCSLIEAANRNPGYYKMYEWRAKARVIHSTYAGLSEYMLCAHVGMHFAF